MSETMVVPGFSGVIDKLFYLFIEDIFLIANDD